MELVDSPSPGSGIADMEKGLIDVVWGGPLRVIKQRDTQAPSPMDLVAFGEVAAKDPFFLVGQPQTKPFALSQLPHMRLGTVSEVPTPWLCLQQDLRDAGIDPMGLARGPERSMGDNLAALARGELDVVQMFEPFVSQAEAQGVGTSLTVPRRMCCSCLKANGVVWGRPTKKKGSLAATSPKATKSMGDGAWVSRCLITRSGPPQTTSIKPFSMSAMPLPGEGESTSSMSSPCCLNKPSAKVA